MLNSKNDSGVLHGHLGGVVKTGPGTADIYVPCREWVRVVRDHEHDAVAEVFLDLELHESKRARRDAFDVECLAPRAFASADRDSGVVDRSLNRNLAAARLENERRAGFREARRVVPRPHEVGRDLEAAYGRIFIRCELTFDFGQLAPAAFIALELPAHGAYPLTSHSDQRGVRDRRRFWSKTIDAPISTESGFGEGVSTVVILEMSDEVFGAAGRPLELFAQGHRVLIDEGQKRWRGEPARRRSVPLGVHAIVAAHALSAVDNGLASGVRLFARDQAPSVLDNRGDFICITGIRPRAGDVRIDAAVTIDAARFLGGEIVNRRECADGLQLRLHWHRAVKAAFRPTERRHEQRE